MTVDDKGVQSCCLDLCIRPAVVLLEASRPCGHPPVDAAHIPACRECAQRHGFGTAAEATQCQVCGAFNRISLSVLLTKEFK